MHTPLALLEAVKAPPLIDIDGTLLVQLGVFLVMLIVLYVLVFRPYVRVRDEREKGITGARGEAREMEERADSMVVDYQAHLTKARQRGAEERLKLRAEGVAHEQQVIAEARAAAEKEIASAREKARAEQEAARAQLLGEAPVVGRQIAARLLGRGV